MNGWSADPVPPAARGRLAARGAPSRAVVVAAPATVPAGALTAALAAALAAALTLPSPASAQSDLQPRLGLFGGAWVASGELEGAPILRDRGAVLSYGEIGTLALVGFGLELHHPSIPLALSLSAGHGLAVEETGRWGCAPDADGNPVPCPSILILVPTDISTTVAAADVGLDFGLSGILVRPTVGVGLVRYAFRWDPGLSQTFSLEPGEASDHSVALRYGLALGFETGRLRWDALVIGVRRGSDRSRPSRAGLATLGVSVPLR